MQSIIICGADTWGFIAYWDYFQKINVAAFVDVNNRCEVNILKTGVPTIHIENLKDISREVHIVVAVKNESERLQSIKILKNLGFNDLKSYLPPSYMTQEYIGSLLRNRYASAIYELKETRSLNLGKFFMDTVYGGGGLELKETTGMYGGSGMLDYLFLYTLARRYNCKKYLEIGTYIGESINVLTDICDELHSITPAPNMPNSMHNWCIYHNIPDYSERLTYSPKIVHHYCNDSKTFDFNTIPRDIDLYFIDGDHTFYGVYCDTKNVFSHRKKNSIVVWHDFKNGNPLEYNECALAVKYALGANEWKNVFCLDMNACGIYIPPELQKDFSFRKHEYSEEPQDLYCYNLKIEVVKK